MVTNENGGKTSKPHGGTAGFDVSVEVEGADELLGKSLVQIEDDPVDCALKIMLSGMNDYYQENVSVKRYLHPDPFTTVENSVFFDRVDLNRDYGVVEGDFITISGATSGANNCTLKPIESMTVTEDGTYCVIGDVTFMEESPTSATASFRSQFDTLGQGLGMNPSQVDVEEHVYWKNLILSAYTYRFVIKETISGKDFLDKEVYLPVGAYSLPRLGRCSMGYHVGPVIAEDLTTLSRENVKDPDKIRLRRTISRNFYNTIIYRFDPVALTDKFIGGSINYSQESRNRIRVGAKALKIESKGLRRADGGFSIAQSVSDRYLARYKFAAEFFEAIGVLFRDGYALEPGDAVMFDPDRLKISNTVDGNRSKPAKLFTVTNKSLDAKTGDVKLSLTDTNFDDSERYGFIAPSSVVGTGSTTTAVIITDSFGELFPGDEYKKWQDYVGLPIVVHSEDYSFSEEVTLSRVDTSNKYKLVIDPTTPLSIPPTAGMIVEIPNYPTDTNPATNAKYKAVHAHLGATVSTVGAADDTHFEVGAGDIGKFVEGDTVRIRNEDYTNDSGELTVVAIAGNIVEVSATMGFTPTTAHVVEAMGFADGSKTYRIF